MFSFRQMEEDVMVTGVNYSPKELLTSLSQLGLNHLPQCLDYQQMCTCVILFLFSPPSKMWPRSWWKPARSVTRQPQRCRRARWSRHHSRGRRSSCRRSWPLCSPPWLRPRTSAGLCWLSLFSLALLPFSFGSTYTTMSLPASACCGSFEQDIGKLEVSLIIILHLI